MPAYDDDDDFPNDFDGLDFDSIPELRAPPISIHASQSSDIPGVASPVSSAGSSAVEEMDAAFLAAVDALEARALDQIHPGPGSLSCEKPGGYATDDNALNTIVNAPQSETSSANRKGKGKAEPQDESDIQTMLKEYEVELTCPICCDLFVGAQITNPCGHTCCGECGYGWLARSKYEPTCAVCRSDLSVRNPLLPNFSVDGLVRQHLQALARSGCPEWQERGYRTIEWNKRLESWKKLFGMTAKEKSREPARTRRHRSRYYQDDEYSYTEPWFDVRMEEDDDAVVARIVSRRGTRSRR